MGLGELLKENRSSIVRRWKDLLIESYPKDSRRFLKKEKDRFSNPVGQTISSEIEAIYDEVMTGKDGEKIASCLENIIKIRAVQDFSPSQAVAFVLQLKGAVRKALKDKGSLGAAEGELESFEEEIDNMALLAFDIYSKQRQKLYELRIEDVKRQVSKLLVRANLVSEIPDSDQGL